METWFASITDAEQIARNVMEVDYEVYAEGEALLGWLNATVQLADPEGFEAHPVLQEFAATMQAYLEQCAEIAHLKMTLSPDAGLGGDVAIINEGAMILCPNSPLIWTSTKVVSSSSTSAQKAIRKPSVPPWNRPRDCSSRACRDPRSPRTLPPRQTRTHPPRHRSCLTSTIGKSHRRP